MARRTLVPIVALVSACVVGLSLLPSLADAEYQWSGYVNSLQDAVDFLCPDNLAVVGIASDFSLSASVLDRRWEFQCASGGGLANVSTSCTQQTLTELTRPVRVWLRETDPHPGLKLPLPQSFINDYREDIEYSCPNDGYVAGFHSEFGPARDDRIWQLTCCERPYATLINCRIPSATWENILRENLNYSSPDGYVIAGLQSFYFNGDRRWRFRACEVEVNCGDPGVPSNAVREGDSFLYQASVTFTCNHGYYQSSGPEGGVRTCLETGLWSDTQPQCSLCTDIPNCADIRCSNTSDHTCALCESHHGPGRGEAAYRNLETECLPLCSWLGSFCYPGVCTDEPASCNCSEGFAGPDCLEITVPPEIEACSTVIRGSDGSNFSSLCSNTSSPDPMYTNIVPYELEGVWDAVFLGPSAPRPEPAYFAGFSVGVAVSEIQATLYRAANPRQAVTMTTHPCGGSAPSPDSPSTTLTMCSTTATPTDLSQHAFLHGDTFTVQVYVENGGYLDITDLDSNDTSRHYYVGTPVVGTTVYIIDLEPPAHCSLVASVGCLTNQRILDLGADVTQFSTVTATWGGWVDVPSGVVSYSIDVYPLVEMDNVLRESMSRIAFSDQPDTGESAYQFVLSLTNEGPYSFVLSTRDQAGNIHYSRRLLLFDASSSLEVDESLPLVVVSAVEGTDFRWQNSTSAPIVVRGRGHFYNSNLQLNNFLAPVANYSAGIEPEYDHPLDTGRYPRGGTPNALGVIQVSYAVVVDQVGGTSDESMRQPTIFDSETTDLAIEAVEVDPDTQVEDGDSVRIWFQALDFKFQEQVDSVLVHIDSSPPILQNLWLEWNGVPGLALLGTGSLLDMSIQFQTYDEHSGVSEIEWWIGTEPGQSDVGYGNVPVELKDQAVCTPDPNCVCDSLIHCSLVQYTFPPSFSHFHSSTEALHDTDYFVTVSITNHALLTSSLTHHITVDTTPPLPGAVFDAPLGVGDVDYQQGNTLQAWWSGYFDRETGVAFYQYAYGTQCVNMSLFSFPLEPESLVVQTMEEYASWLAPGDGTYYVTVVAYNNALQPSEPVCSDGITVDNVSPVFEGIRIPGSVVEPGLVVSWSLGEVWLVEGDRQRVYVGRATENEVCVNRSTPVDDLSQYPIRMRGSLPAVLDPTLCPDYPPFNPSITYLTTDTLLNVSWSAADNVGIREYYIAITPLENYTQDAASLTFHRTASHTHYSIHNPTMLTSGGSFYLSVRAVDHALLDTRLDVGPVRVDITPPQVNGSVRVEWVVGEGVRVVWGEGAFLDPEDLGSALQFDYAIGRSEYGTDIQPFMPLPQSPSSLCPTPYCFVVDTSTITTPLLGGHQYYFTIRATNGAGLSSAIPSPPYVHIAAPPSSGFVRDIDPSLSFDVSTTGISLHSEDVDLLIDQTELTTSWKGFEHTNLLTIYSVGLGSEPGLDDIIGFTYVASATDHTFSTVDLVAGQVYYATVIAQNNYGNQTAISNGVVVLKGVEEEVSRKATVYDGILEREVDYQVSSTQASAQWRFPQSIAPFVSLYKVALFAGDADNMIEVEPYRNVGNSTSLLVSDLSLEEGELYVFAVRACFATMCLSPAFSDGFRLASDPIPKPIVATYTPLQWNDPYGSSGSGILTISWETFEDPELSYYEWSLGTGEPGYELLVYWSRVERDENRVTVALDTVVSLHTPNTVTVRGYNGAGLHSASSSPLDWIIEGTTYSQDRVPRTPLVVIDVPESQVPDLDTSDWRDLEHSVQDLTDLQYSSSPSSISAAWPGLRYMRYDYSVSTIQAFQHCGSEDGLVCGTTIANAVTITGLNLVNGERYYVCLQAFRSDAIHPTQSTPGVYTACTNGITMDLSPPESGGCVQIVTPSVIQGGEEIESGDGPSGFLPILDETQDCVDNGSRFQASVSEIHIRWNQFLDSEQFGNAVHVSGVAYYEVAVGTSPGSTDTVDFTSVGVSTETILTGLSLRSGTTYYATVRAYDFTGQWSALTSPGVTVDVTPPTFGSIWLEGVTDTDNLRAFWEPVEECESELVTVEWGVGTRPGSSDLMAWTQATTDQLSGSAIDGLELVDGQLVFISLMAQNGAGLVSLATSIGYRLDTTSPDPGVVYDGPQPDSGSGNILDLDYTVDAGVLSAHWRGFSDPHTGIAEYYWAIGTCPDCSDVQTWLSVGAAEGATRTGLSLTHGKTYYVTVRGCNSVGLCSQATSNGITVDTTPPIPARVLDGYNGEDLRFQASRSQVSAHWSGFHDSESSLAHFIVFVGLRPNDSSVLPPTTLPSSASSFLLPSPLLIPTNRTLHTTLIAYNRAGLYVQVSSNGVYIDDTPPTLSGPVAIDTEWAGSVVVGTTQYSRSAVRVNWEFQDSLTTVEQHFWSLVSAEGVASPLPSQLSKMQGYGTSTGLELSDGEQYYAIVFGCNAVGLCTEGISNEVLYDSTPPIDGYFAADSDSAFGLSYAVPGGMTWRNFPGARRAHLNLAFIGFSDPHSGIVEYWVTTGSNYSLADLTSGANQLDPLQASENGTLLAVVRLGRVLEPSELIYVSLWAVNGVGLKSHIVQQSFRVDTVPDRTNNGTLTLLRSSSCRIESCLGHCTCAARGQLCSTEPALPANCTELDSSTLPSDMQLDVRNVVPQGNSSTGVLYTAITDKLVGEWEKMEADSSAFQWLEWSVGEKGAPPGFGLVDLASGLIWRNPGTDSYAIFAASPSLSLEHGRTYVFYVRAWYSATEYAVFVSEGVTVDTAGPQIARGLRTREVRELGSEMDVDYWSSTSELFISWSGVFSTALSGNDSVFEVGLGESPGSDSNFPFTLLSPGISSFRLAPLALSDGKVYYSTVRARNPNDIIVYAISDGFSVDLSPPNLGTVFDGSAYKDLRAQSNTTALKLRIFGFNDPDSYIHHYEYAITDSPQAPSEAEYMDMGIRLVNSLTELSLVPGTTYYGHVVAENIAGLKSEDAASNGIVVGDTRPVGIRCSTYSPEILQNPSFEGPTGTPVHCSGSIALSIAVSGWEHEDIYSEAVPSSAEFVPYDGCFSLYLVGRVSQSFTTNPGSQYRMTVAVSRYPFEDAEFLATFQFKLVAPGIERIFNFPPQQNGAIRASWTRVEVVFEAEGTVSEISLETLGDEYGVLVDGFSIKECASTVTLDSNETIVQWSNIIHIGQEYISSSLTRIYGNWDIASDVSGIGEYLWAVGTVAGGEQLQRYTSTGNAKYGVSEELLLTHGMSIYISVIAWSYGGLERVVYSEPFVVDLTAPEGEVTDGPLAGQDIDYQSFTVISADWSGIVDRESGISECRWALGSSPGENDIQGYLITSISSGSSSDLSSITQHGTTVYSTVVCTNGAGLSMTSYSNGVTVLLDPPSSFGAFAYILSSNFTRYEPQGGYIPTDDLTLIWGGFTDAAQAPLVYEVRVNESASLGGEWMNVGFAKMLILSELELPGDIRHTVEVRAVNYAGVSSTAVPRDFIILSSPPQDNGVVINSTWTSANTLQLDWSGRFSSPAPIYYEFSLGTQVGSSSIRRWVEQGTDLTRVTIIDARLRPEVDYFLSLTAIGSSGLHTTVDHMIASMPLVG